MSFPCNFAAAAKPGEFGVPQRKPNGGLYTGEAFAGPWGNVPMPRDTGAISAKHLFHAFLLPTPRPGNDSLQQLGPGHAVHFTDLVATFPRRVTRKGRR